MLTSDEIRHAALHFSQIPGPVPLPDEDVRAKARISALRAVGGEFDYSAAISGLEDLHQMVESLEGRAKVRPILCGVRLLLAELRDDHNPISAC